MHEKSIFYLLITGDHIIRTMIPPTPRIFDTSPPSRRFLGPCADIVFELLGAAKAQGTNPSADIILINSEILLRVLRRPESSSDVSPPARRTFK